MQGTQVQSLVQEDFTCHRATVETQATQETEASQLLKPMHLAGALQQRVAPICLN